MVYATIIFCGTIPLEAFLHSTPEKAAAFGRFFTAQRAGAEHIWDELSEDGGQIGDISFTVEPLKENESLQPGEILWVSVYVDAAGSHAQTVLHRNELEAEAWLREPADGSQEPDRRSKSPVYVSPGERMFIAEEMDGEDERAFSYSFCVKFNKEIQVQANPEKWLSEHPQYSLALINSAAGPLWRITIPRLNHAPAFVSIHYHRILEAMAAWDSRPRCDQCHEVLVEWVSATDDQEHVLACPDIHCPFCPF
jgi:hypothetical protein